MSAPPKVGTLRDLHGKTRICVAVANSPEDLGFSPSELVELFLSAGRYGQVHWWAAWRDLGPHPKGVIL